MTETKYTGLPEWMQKYDLVERNWNGVRVFFGNVPVKVMEPNNGQVEGLPENPRQWTRKELETLKKSIIETPELMIARGVLLFPYNGKAVALGGNMRLTASRELKEKEVPAIVYPEDTPTDKLMEIVIKDNGSFGAWDFDRLGNEWSDKPLTDWGVPAWDPEEEDKDEIDDVQEDEFSEATGEALPPVVKRGEVWQLGIHRLICGDSTQRADILKLMQGEVADLWLTDPPYNVNYVEKNKDIGGQFDIVKEDIANDNMSDVEFDMFLCEAFAVARDVLKAGGSFYVWTPQGHNQIAFHRALDGVGLQFRQQLIWNKSGLVMGRQDYQWKHEPCLYGWKDGAGHYFKDTRKETTVIQDAAEIVPKKMKKQDLVKFVEAVLSDRIETSVLNEQKPMKSGLHPTMKPIRLFARLISNSSRRGEVVLDTFAGSGTTVIACEQLGRAARVVEIDPHYCDVIIARWEELTGQKAERIETA